VSRRTTTPAAAFAAALAVPAFFAAAAFALDVPAVRGRVTDMAGMLTPGERTSLERQLAEVEARTSNQIAVLTVPALEGDNLEAFSLRVARDWKLGQEGKDNGVLLLVVRDDRMVRIEVGSGLEGALTDDESKRIIDQAIVPEFRAGRFGPGIVVGVHSIMEATQRELISTPAERAAPDSVAAMTPARRWPAIPWVAMGWFLVIGLIVLTVIAGRLGRSSQPGRSGVDTGTRDEGNGWTYPSRSWSGSRPSRSWSSGSGSSHSRSSISGSSGRSGFSGGGGRFGGRGASGKW
jgi:uncharacterized protein